MCMPLPESESVSGAITIAASFAVYLGLSWLLRAPEIREDSERRVAAAPQSGKNQCLQKDEIDIVAAREALKDSRTISWEKIRKDLKL